jgi:Protein of unknown function (DUF2934)
MRGQTKNSITEEDIRGRAYEIYQQRGGRDGRELDDWLQAEIELEKSHGEESSRRKKK